MTAHPIARALVMAGLLRQALAVHLNGGSPSEESELEWRRALSDDWADFDRPCEALASRDPGRAGTIDQQSHHL